MGEVFDKRTLCVYILYRYLSIHTLSLRNTHSICLRNLDIYTRQSHLAHNICVVEKKIRTLFYMCVVVIVCVSSMIIIIVISAGCADPVPFIPSPNRSTYRYYIIIILKRCPIGCSGGSTTTHI